jgi:hypothetical protein
LAGTATGVPKARTGPVEAIRALRVARHGAVKARTAALNQLHGLIAAAPEPVRALLAGHIGAALLQRCTQLTVDASRLADPAEASKAALAAIAARCRDSVQMSSGPRWYLSPGASVDFLWDRGTCHRRTELAVPPDAVGTCCGLVAVAQRQAVG